MHKRTNRQKAQVIIGIILFGITMLVLLQLYQDYALFIPVPLSQEDIMKYKNTEKAVVVYPFFTQYAYSDNGFYSYYSKSCGVSCLTVHFNPFNINPTYNTGKTAFDTLLKLNYPVITDMYIDQHPDILLQYDKVIILHLEYSTPKIYHSITSHKNVIYLFPNSFYGLISVDYNTNNMTLIKGHGYNEDINNTNPFGWQFDITHPNEYDYKCKNWYFINVTNGKQLSCYPELLITHERELLKQIKES